MADEFPADLSNDAKLAIAIAAGCKIETVWKENRFIIRTVYPVCIRITNGKIIVYQGPLSSGVNGSE